MSRLRAQDGQASVELVALLPLLAVVAAVLWQAVVAGQAVWLAGTAARRVLTPRLGETAQVATASDGAITVRVRVPSVLGNRRSLGTFTTRARFAAQGG